MANAASRRIVGVQWDLGERSRYAWDVVLGRCARSSIRAPSFRRRSVTAGGAAWLPWALLSAAFAAITAVFAKAGVSEINPNYATFIRTLVIAAFIAILLAVSGGFQSPAALPRRALLFLVLSGLATGASWLCYFRALSLGPAAQVASIDKLSVVLVALFAVNFLSEQLSLRNWLGIGFIGLGAVLVAHKAG
jgi:transporter family protein